MNYTRQLSPLYSSGGRSSTSREKSYSRLNLKSREDPHIKQRLDNLMQSAKTYKTKACGVMRNPAASASGMDNTRVVIERKRAGTGLPLSPRSPPTVSGGHNSRERQTSYTRLKQTYMNNTNSRTAQLPMQTTSRKRLTSLRASTATINNSTLSKP